MKSPRDQKFRLRNQLQRVLIHNRLTLRQASIRGERRTIVGKNNHGQKFLIRRSPYADRNLITGPMYGNDLKVRASARCANSFKMKRVVSQEIRVCFLTYKVDEQPNKKHPKKATSPKRRESEDKECCGYCDKRITIGLCITRLGRTRF